MIRFKPKKEPEYIFLPRSKQPQSCTFEWITLAIVCCLSVITILLNLGIHP